MTSRLREVTDGVWVATSRRYATTSTVLLDGAGGAVVIDPAWDPDELAAIPADLAELGVICVAGLATHEHYDHVLWHPALGDVPRWASPGTVQRLAQSRDEILEPLASFLTPDLIAIAGRLTPLPDGSLPWSGAYARAIVHDAHAVNHLALLVEESGVLVSGDMMSDVELPMPDSGDPTLDRYVEGLSALRVAAASARWLIPGHGSPTDRPLERYDADMRYLDDLISGRPSADPRIGHRDNAELHAANLAKARGV